MIIRREGRRGYLTVDWSPDTSRIVARAVRLVTEGALDGKGGVEDLATRLGVGDRHLRRLFARHLGASPIALAQTHRVHFARRLLDETTLSITDVAMGAGFSSVRRFNDVFRRTFSMSPCDVRALRQPPPAGGLQLRLPYVPPYDWASMLEFLRARARPGVECVVDGGYRITRRFPSATRVLEADLNALGLPRTRAHAIRGLAKAIVDGSLVLDGSRGLDETVVALRGLPGIGEWTTEYIAMRALAEPDAFPAGDLAVRRALSRNGNRPSQAAIRRTADAWRPFRAYAVLHLWRSLT